MKTKLWARSSPTLAPKCLSLLPLRPPSTEYWFRSYAIVDGEFFYGDALSFVTKGVSSGDGTQTAYAMSWLGGYEVPATSVAVSESDMMYEGRYCHSTVTESYGGTSACIYNTENSTERIVTHTYSYNDSASAYTLSQAPYSTAATRRP